MLGPITTGIDSTELAQEERELLKHPLVNGVILFSRNYQSPSQLTELCRQIKTVNEQLLISVDHEGGRVQRFCDGFTQLPTMQDAYKLSDDLEPLTVLGWTLAAELLAVNVDFSYAPCVDVDGISQVIGTRAFSSDPDAVANAATFLISGLHQAGMKSVIKHFPGHGSVGPDSHVAMPIDPRSLEEILAYDFKPFKFLIDKGFADAVMPAHVIYQQVDPLPACFSPFWLKTILRERLAFKGAIISDDMGMQGAVQMGDYPARVKQALDAGCDSVLLCNDKQGLFDVLDSLPIEQYKTHGRRLSVFNHTQYPSFQEVKSDARWQACQQYLNR